MLPYIEKTAELRDVNLDIESLYVPIAIQIAFTPEAEMEDSLLAYAIKNVAREILLNNKEDLPIILINKNNYILILEKDSPEHIDLQENIFKFRRSIIKYLHVYTHCMIGKESHMYSIFTEAQSMLQHIDNYAEAFNKARSVVDKVKLLIKENINRNITREWISSEVFLNIDYLGRVFKKETGQTLLDYITSQKIERSKQILEQTSKSISEVALELGYGSFSYFSQIFKKSTGISPNDYRKQIQSLDILNDA